MKKMRKMFLISLVLLISMSTSIFADTLKDQQKDVQNKIKDTQNKINEVKSEKSEVLKQVESLDKQISNTENEIVKLEDDIDSINKEIENTEKELENAKKEYEENEELLADRLVAIYEAGETSFIDVLFSSKNLSDFISKYFLVSEIMENDTNMLSEIDQKKNNIEEMKNKLSEQKTKLESTRQNKTVKVSSLEKSVKQKNEYVGQLNANEKSLAQVLEDQKKQLKALDDEIKRQEALVKLNPSLTSDMKFVWPVRGTTKSDIYWCAHFKDPNYRGTHYGIDISSNIRNADGSLKNIMAAGAGQVVTVGYQSGGFGNYVVIYHGTDSSGKKIYTLYAHASQIYVKLNQTVNAGDSIARIGTTGNSSGNHLHFEVRKGGNTTAYAINPENLSYTYLK